MKKIVFDGELSYICPHCGTEQDAVLASWTAWGMSEVSFSVAGGEIEPEDEVDVRDYDDVQLDEEYYCPKCYKCLTAEDVMDGLRKWLERLKEEDPEGYAKIIAELL